MRPHELRRLTQKVVFALGLLYSIFLFTAPTHIVSADGGFFCSPSSGAASQNDIGNCVNNLYRFGIIAASIGAVFLIILAGYYYMFSGGDEHRVSSAKSLITSSIVGLLILLAGLLILRQINPALLSFKSISPEQISSQAWTYPDGTVVYSSTQPPGTESIKGKDVKQCPEGIVAIPVDIAGRTGERACKTLIAALQLVKTQATSQGIKFIVTDAYGQGHQSLCHKQYGTCADLVPTNPTPENWNKLCIAVKATGRFRILNEYRGGGAPECGSFTQTKLSTGAHIHIVMQGSLDDLSGTK